MPSHDPALRKLDKEICLHNRRVNLLFAGFVVLWLLVGVPVLAEALEAGDVAMERGVMVAAMTSAVAAMTARDRGLRKIGDET